MTGRFDMMDSGPIDVGITAPRQDLTPEYNKVILAPDGKYYRWDGEEWCEVRFPNSHFPTVLDIEEVGDDDMTQSQREEDERKRICIYCGKVQASVEELALHEETCD